MGDEPCDVGPAEAAVMTRWPWRCAWCGQLEGTSHKPNCTMVRLEEFTAAVMAPKRHHPAGIAPVAERPYDLIETLNAVRQIITDDLRAERDERAQRRSAERNLMDFYTDPCDYRAACDAMKPAVAPNVEAGKTFARLIAKG